MKNTDNLKSLNINSVIYKTRISGKFAKRKPYQPVNPNLVFSFIPGTVTEIMVREGETVEKGDALLVLDAMKMQNRLKSAVKGRIKKIYAKTGDRVAKGILLIETK